MDFGEDKKNTTHKVRENCYKKHRVHWFSVNIVTTTCTTATLTTYFHDFSQGV
jgi:hypothetical protein